MIFGGLSLYPCIYAANLGIRLSTSRRSEFRKHRVLRVPATNDADATGGIKEFKAPASERRPGFFLSDAKVSNAARSPLRVMANLSSSGTSRI